MLFPLELLILRFNLRLVEVIFWLIHLKVNLLLLLKLVIFFSSCSHFLKILIFPSPNSFLIDACMFLILFNYHIRSNFLNDRINFILKHKLSSCHQWLLQVYWKMFTYTTDGIFVENFILYNIMCERGSENT